MPTPTGSPETPEPAQRAGSGRSGRCRDRTQHDRRHGEDVVSDEPDSQGETLARARGDSSGQRPADHLTHRPRNASRPPLRRRRRVAPAWAALSLLAGLLGLLALLSPVAAQSVNTTLVSNAGQGRDTNSNEDYRRAQAFTTTAGATLSSVEIISEDTEGDDVAVSLCTVDANDRPTSSCTDLTAPLSFPAGTLVFTAPANTTLAANTTYSLVITSPGGESLKLDATRSGDEDDGGATDWSIADTLDYELFANAWRVQRGRALRITIKGTPPNRAPAVATEIPDQTATLSMAFSYQVPAATFTDADGDTLTYTATLADDTALPSWLSFSAATRTFSGTPTDAGTFSVKVTASDASESVSDTFDIVVGLPPDTSPTLVSNAGQRDDAAWSSGADRSQAFTTSASATLSSVEIISEDQHSDDAAVSLCTVDGSNHPTSDCTPLTAPSSFARGTLVFHAPANTTLAANTTYSLVVASPGGQGLTLDATRSDDEDAGGATDWSIANTFDIQTGPDAWVTNIRALRITIKGTTPASSTNIPTVATAIPDQTATTGTAFSYQVPAATFTDADGDTLTYRATLADDTALPSWLSFSATTRTFSGTPTAAETVSVKVTASDASESVSDTFDIVVGLPADTTAPRVASIVRQNPTSSPTNADSLTWRVTFSEAVSNVDAADFAVSGTTATVTAVAAVSGVTGAYDVTASGGDLANVSATVTLAISSSHNIQDGASNALSNTAPTGTNDNSYVVDNTAPTVTISGVPATSDAPFTATFTFSEAVTGFAVGDITLGNATASSFTATSTTVYTALVTPAADGAVTVDVPANAAQDADGNGNTAATRASSIYAVPAITITAGTSPVTEGTSAVFTLSRTGSPAAALAVNVTVSETGGDMVEASNEGDQTVTFLANAATATLSVATLPDGVDQANSVVTATISADTGSPASYSVGTPASAMVTVEDNDTRGVTVSTTALTVNEGLPGSYTVVLDSQPTANVTVTPSRTGSSDVTFSPPTLTFTTRNWNTVQEVTVTAAQDSDAVDDSATISHAVTGGDYVGVTVESVVVTVNDDDTVETAAELDRAALVALYDNAGGDGWYLTTNWKTSQPLSAWFGVTTDSDGRVTVLHLNSINMVGTLPAQLGNLTALEQLDLAASPQLTGQIPDLSGLTSLQQLFLYENQLTGEIPNWLGSLTALTLVALSGNQLEGAIPDLSNLSSLETLNLAGNELTGEIPDLLGSLTALEFLNLSGNELTGAIPDSLGSLTALEFLYLSHNELTGAIPDSLGSLTALELLRLSHNELTGAIPDSLGSLTALEFLLDLSHNELTGAIPDSLGSLTALESLDLSHNELTGAIPDLSNLTSLERLYLDENQLTGEIPDLSGLTALRRLSLAGNQLTGEMPDSLDNIISLQLLNLNNNLLTGAVLNFRSSNGLKRTRFANNALTGCVPHSLRDLVDASSFTYGITQDFIAVDANEDGDTDDEGDVPGLNLPFCMLSGLTLSGLDLDPAFASGTMTYTAEGTGTSTTVTAIRYESSDQLSVRKGTTSYSEGDAIPLDVGSNVLEIEVTPTDQRLLKQTHTVDIVVSLPDTTAPRVASIVRETPTSSPTNADSLTWRVTFSEAVSNVDAADFVVSGTTATVTAVAAVSGVTAAYDVTASGGDLASVSATVTLTISSSHNIEDGASNALSNTAPTGTNDNSYVLDNAAPIVTISGVPSASNAPFTATFTFSEAVTGFAMGDITLTNASASNFTATSTTVSTALVTPTASGTVTVDVPANAAQDAAGNGNTAATRASSTYAPPAITIVAGTSPVTEGTPAVFTLSRAGSPTAALAVNVTVSETGGDMVAASNEGDQTVTFLANAATATLSVTTASDNVDEANSVVTATVAADTRSPAGYSVGTPASAMVTVEDNDTRDVTVSPTALTVNEGTTGSYTVVLGSQPTASVTVTPSRTGSSDVTFSPATLTFTTSTWNTVQEVTVTVAQDSDAVDDSATISHAVTTTWV